MPRVSLAGGFYQARSLIAAAQRCCNLYPETNPPEAQAPSPVTLYQFPGLTQLSVSPTIERVRSQYRATNGDLYEVVGPKVYFVSNLWQYTLLGTIPDQATPASFSDNGLAVAIVDGTAAGYVIDMADHQFATIVDPSFQGGRKTDQIDGFFVFDVIGTNEFYISLLKASFGMMSGTAIGNGSISAPGAGYIDGVYNGVPLTGGTGTGATAIITVTGGAVVAVDPGASGKNYTVGDVLSASAANLGGAGVGFTWTFTTAAPAFDPLDIATKGASADPIQSFIVVHDELWLVGALTTEVWVNSGAADFVLQKLPGTFIEHGCIAPYSLIANGNSCFWLAQDRKGKGKIYRSEGYDADEISTRAMNSILQKYPTLSDAIGMCLQIEGHIFYILVFPTADKSWCYDIEEKRWFELFSIDQNGVEHRTRANCCAYAYETVVIGDWQNGALYQLDPENFTENGNPIKWLVTFPHMMKDGVRVTYTDFEADMEVGNFDVPGEPLVDLRWSDNRGKTYGNSVPQLAGAAGEYETWITWNNLGMARDRVFELSWSFAAKTALNGAFVNTEPSET